MPVLSDVNVLLAIATDRHAHHRVAKTWLDGTRPGEVFVCRLAQMGFLRLLNNPSVMQEDVLDCEASWTLWLRLASDERFRLAFSEPAGLDRTLEGFIRGRTFSPRPWTDAYLAAFAVEAELTLVTFDRGFGLFSGLDLIVLGPGPAGP